MKHESELVTAASEGFRKWLTVAEIYEFITAERARVAKAPTLYLVVFDAKLGYVKLNANIVKVQKEVDETGRIVDLELYIVNEDITEPVKLLASFFQPDSHPNIKFCKIFKLAKDRDNYYDDICFLVELNSTYYQSMIEFMRRQLGF